jgi:hypothetical protein
MNEKNICEQIPEYYNGFPVREILKALESVNYGYVQIIVQDNKVVQIDRMEKVRIINKEQ